MNTQGLGHYGCDMHVMLGSEAHCASDMYTDMRLQRDTCEGGGLPWQGRQVDGCMGGAGAARPGRAGASVGWDECSRIGC